MCDKAEVKDSETYHFGGRNPLMRPISREIRRTNFSPVQTKTNNFAGLLVMGATARGATINAAFGTRRREKFSPAPSNLRLLFMYFSLYTQHTLLVNVSKINIYFFRKLTSSLK